jgi:hypothetical protein
VRRTNLTIMSSGSATKPAPGDLIVILSFDRKSSPLDAVRAQCFVGVIRRKEENRYSVVEEGKFRLLLPEVLKARIQTVIPDFKR